VPGVEESGSPWPRAEGRAWAGERVGAAGRVQEDGGLVAPPLGRLEEGVPRLVGELARIDLVPLGGTHQPFSESTT